MAGAREAESTLEVRWRYYTLRLQGEIRDVVRERQPENEPACRNKGRGPVLVSPLPRNACGENDRLRL